MVPIADHTVYQTQYDRLKSHLQLQKLESDCVVRAMLPRGFLSNLPAPPKPIFITVSPVAD